MFTLRREAQPHEAIEYAKKLYSKGIELINSKDAYQGAGFTESGDLLQEMKSVEQFDAVNGRATAKCPLEAVFVIKVALDHMKTDEILSDYRKFREQLINARLDNSRIVFSDTTQLFGHNALIQVMRCYIENQARFEAADRQAARDEKHQLYNSYFHIVGSDAFDKKDDVIAMLSKNMFVNSLNLRPH